MKLHLDGARIANAAAALGVPLRAFTADAGVDVLSFGGTKNGLMFGEAIVVLEPSASEGLVYLRKLNMQLASKMRFGRRSSSPCSSRRPRGGLGSARDPRERDGRAPPHLPRGPHRRRRGTGTRLQPADPGQRGVRDPASGRPRPLARTLPLLRLGRRQGRGALDVLVRHHEDDIDAFVAAIREELARA